MTIVEVMRVLTSIVWFALLVYLWKPFRATTRADGTAKPSELVMSAVWLLCLNRLTFSGVTQFAPDDDAALTMCYVFAFFAGLYMLVMCSLARRRA